MSEYDPFLHRRSGKGILRWLGLGSGEAPGDSDDAHAPPPETDPLRAARRELVNEIGAFIAAHDLEVSPFTLAVAHDYLTGGASPLTNAIDRRISAGEAVTLDWLEQAERESGGDQRAVLTQLMGKLETNIDEVDRTSAAAKTAASDYNSALEVHVGELRSTDRSAAVIGDLVDLARAMLERTRDLERDMSQSLLQTRSLRRSLNQARRSAEEDHLTGLPNRRAFEQRLVSEYTAAMSANEPLCVAFCDIDHFKRVNDEHGHDAGDRVLKTVAQSLARISDDRCHVARHGGEEFVVLLRGRVLHEAWEVLDEARRQLAERRLINRATDTPFGKVTISGGIADVFAFPDARAALRAADRALYAAKSEGRNRILTASRDIAPDLRKIA